MALILWSLPDRTLTVGESVRILRQLAGFSQQEFADRIGIHQTHLSRIESGDHIPIRVTWLRILGALPKELRRIPLS